MKIQMLQICHQKKLHHFGNLTFILELHIQKHNQFLISLQKVFEKKLLLNRKAKGIWVIFYLVIS